MNDEVKQAHVIQCWSCGTRKGLDEVREADGYCPECDVEIDLAEYYPKLAADYDALRTQVVELRAQVVAQDRLIRKCGDWIEAARDDVIYPLASGTEHDVAIHEEAHGLGQTSATLIADIDAMIAATSAPEVQCKACNDTACDPSHEELVPCLGCAAKPAHVDDFRGDDAALVSSAKALLALDEKGALTGGGIGGHARTIIGAFIARMAEQGERQEAVAVKSHGA
ncbi:hypothetical protein, partial [Bowmanella yangjiangensis]